jgi:hypothetical protein
VAFKRRAVLLHSLGDFENEPAEGGEADGPEHDRAHAISPFYITHTILAPGWQVHKSKLDCECG